jgi:hypothetical protein
VCMAHVINLGAQQILQEYKQPVENRARDDYESGTESSDTMVRHGEDLQGQKCYIPSSHHRCCNSMN